MVQVLTFKPRGLQLLPHRGVQRLTGFYRAHCESTKVTKMEASAKQFANRIASGNERAMTQLLNAATLLGLTAEIETVSVETATLSSPDRMRRTLIRHGPAVENERCSLLSFHSRFGRSATAIGNSVGAVASGGAAPLLHLMSGLRGPTP